MCEVFRTVSSRDGFGEWQIFVLHQVQCYTYSFLNRRTYIDVKCWSTSIPRLFDTYIILFQLFLTSFSDPCLFQKDETLKNLVTGQEKSKELRRYDVSLYASVPADNVIRLFIFLGKSA